MYYIYYIHKYILYTAPSLLLPHPRCESNCPSKDLSLTPRQRIQVFKEMTRMRDDFTASGDRNKPERLIAFEKSWEYAEVSL